MSLSKPRLLASGLVLAGLGAVALGFAAPHLGSTLLPGAADRSALVQTVPAVPSPIAVAEAPAGGVPDYAPSAKAATEPNVRVDAPHTSVDVNKDSGKVAVRAPYTDVKVDPDKGRVRVRAPYVDLDIRW